MARETGQFTFSVGPPLTDRTLMHTHFCSHCIWVTYIYTFHVCSQQNTVASVRGRAPWCVEFDCTT